MKNGFVPVTGDEPTVEISFGKVRLKANPDPTTRYRIVNSEPQKISETHDGDAGDETE